MSTAHDHAGQGEMFGRDPQTGEEYSEQELVAFGDDLDAQGLDLYFRHDNGTISGVSPDDGELFPVHADGTPDLSDLVAELDVTEQMLWGTFRTSSESDAEAFQKMNTYMEQVEAHHGTRQIEDEATASAHQFVRDHPELVDDDAFRAVLRETGNVDVAHQIHSDMTAKIADEAAKLGGADEWDDAATMAYAEGQFGSRAETAPKRANNRTSLGDAIDDWVGTDVASENAQRKTARRVAEVNAAVRRQETRGKGG